MYGKDELEHIYGEWMGEDIPQSKATYEMMDFLESRCDNVVKSKLFHRYDDLTEEEKEYLRYVETCERNI